MDANDALLLRRLCQGRDPEAFSEIVRLYAGVVYGACKRIIRDSDQAADVAQETFFQLFRNAADVSGSLAGWLHTVATHKAIDIVRRDSSRRTREAEYSKSKLGEAESWDEISPYVDQALGQIDNELRQVLVTHFLEGLTMREISERMGVSLATVSRKVDAGLNSLRTLLKKRGVIVAAISLSTLMTQNAAQAAPAALMAELGKMSLAAGTVATAKVTAGAAMTAIKAKVVTAVAVAAIGTGAVVTYNNVTKEPAPEAEVTTSVIDDSASASNSQTVVPSGNNAQQEWQTLGDEVETEEKPDTSSPTPVIAEENVEPEPELQAQEPQETAKPRVARSRRRRSTGGGMMGMGGGKVEESNEEEETQQYYGGMMGGSSEAEPPEKNR